MLAQVVEDGLLAVGEAHGVNPYTLKSAIQV
jgi:hypothetical protein